MIDSHQKWKVDEITLSARRTILQVLQWRCRLHFRRMVRVCQRRFQDLWLNLQKLFCDVKSKETDVFHCSWLLYWQVHPSKWTGEGGASKALLTTKMSLLEIQRSERRTLDFAESRWEEALWRKTAGAHYTCGCDWCVSKVGCFLQKIVYYFLSGEENGLPRAASPSVTTEYFWNFLWIGE